MTDRSRPGAALILAAGEGTRMRSAVPKVLHPIGGRSLLGHAVHAVAELDPEQLVVVLGHGGEQVQEAVTALGDELARPVTVAVQEQRLGTGHAVQCGLAALPGGITGPVLVTYGDVPLLCRRHARHAAWPSTPRPGRRSRWSPPSSPTPPATAAWCARRTAPSPGSSSRPTPPPEERAIREVNSGVYAFDGAFLTDGPRAALDGEQPGRALPHRPHQDRARRRRSQVRGVICPDEWQVRGANDRVQLAELGAELNRRLLEEWMRSGVTVVDPATTWVDVQVRLERDVVLRPGTQLHGATTVGGGAEIGPDTTLTDVVVGPGARVVRTHGSDSEIGAGASVGPFAYLRPGARLGERGKIGTFVEVKNAEIGEGSKVPHLTYVGDATIGEHSNIGASSTFVNYDGIRKHRTMIGSHVRTGSDTKFIAPLSVGDGAYTGAGAVLKNDVPPGALAVSGGPQRIIEGWVEKNRPDTPAAEAARAATERLNQQ